MVPSVETRTPSHRHFTQLERRHRSLVHFSATSPTSPHPNKLRRVDSAVVPAGTSLHDEHSETQAADMSNWRHWQDEERFSSHQGSRHLDSSTSSQRRQDSRAQSSTPPPERTLSSLQDLKRRENKLREESRVSETQTASHVGETSSLDKSLRSHSPIHKDHQEGRDRMGSHQHEDTMKVRLPPISALTSSLGSFGDRGTQADTRPTGSNEPMSSNVREPMKEAFESRRPRLSPPLSAWYSHEADRSPIGPSADNKQRLPPRSTENDDMELDRPSHSSSTAGSPFLSKGGFHRTSPSYMSGPAPSVRPGRADSTASDVDRLFDNLTLIQDVNRRNGLKIGERPSTSIFNDHYGSQILLERIYSELDTLKAFSPTQAELIAADLGLQVPEDVSQEVIAHPARFPEGSRTAPASIGAFGPAYRPLDAGRSPHLDRPHWHNSSNPRHPPQDEQSDRYLGRPIHDRPHHSDLKRSRSPVGAEMLTAGPPHPESMRALSSAPYVSEDFPMSAGPYARGHYLTRGEPSVLASHRLAPYPSGAPGLPPGSSQSRSGGMSFARLDERQQQQLELLDRRRMAGKGMKRVRKRKNEHHQECLGCQAKETPEWRKGPMGPRTLCNACGLLYAKLTRRKQQEAEAAAKASGKSPEEVAKEMEESASDKQASLEALRAELNLANGLRNRPMAQSGSSSAESLYAPPPHGFAPYPPTGAYRMAGESYASARDPHHHLRGASGSPRLERWREPEQRYQRSRAHTMSQLAAPMASGSLRDERKHAFSYEEDRRVYEHFRPASGPATPSGRFEEPPFHTDRPSFQPSHNARRYS